MKQAKRSDKQLVTSILAGAFNDNKSVNYIVQQDGKRQQRIRLLMDYSFEVCYLFGKVYLSDDDKACALVLYPHKKKFSFYSAWLDLKLALQVIGISRIASVLKREQLVKAQHPQTTFTYLWFIGVEPGFTGKGLGTKMLKHIMEESRGNQLPVYLETSTEKNFGWYEKLGFEAYHEFTEPYRLVFYKLAGIGRSRG